MSMPSEVLLAEALDLAPDDRAKLAAELLASLDDETADEAEVERLWSEETERRADQIASGEVKLVTWDHLVERIGQRRSASPAG